MRHSRWRTAVVCALVSLIFAACSKKEKPGDQAATTQVPESATPAPVALTTENAPFAPVITEKGFQVVQAKRFPAQVDGRRAAVVVYRTRDGARGGVLYVRGFESDPPRPVWHWYFGNAAPDSVTAVDINRDGLWDVRMYMAGGTTTDYIQDTDFTFGGAERAGLAAMNGASSKGEGLFKAFDADTSTTWQSPSSGAYIDIPNPFGLSKGQLSVRLAGGSRANKLEIGDGTQKLQECNLDATVEEQRFQLDAVVKALPNIRVTVVGPGKNVALSELEIQ